VQSKVEEGDDCVRVIVTIPAAKQPQNKKMQEQRYAAPTA